MAMTGDDKHTKAIYTLYSEICNDLNVNYIIDNLVADNVFTAEEKNEILSASELIGDVNDPQCRKKALRRQTERFLLKILLKDNMREVIDAFVDVLRKDDNYPWLANRIHRVIYVRVYQKCSFVLSCALN